MSHVMFSVDVEGVHGDHPLSEFIYGRSARSNSEAAGVLAIADLLHSRSMVGVFFVDVYERRLFGDACMSRLIDELLERGQDVQLHTHPSWRDDARDPAWLRRKKEYLRTKSNLAPMLADNAPEVIRSQLIEGMEFLESRTGAPTIAHRSGGYSVDDEVLDAAVEVGLKVDSSANPVHSNSKVDWPVNSVGRIRPDLWQVPIFVADFTIAGVRRRAKVAIETLPQSATELSRLFPESSKNAITGHVMMHSYSLLQTRVSLSNSRAAASRTRKLTRLLDRLISVGLTTVDSEGVLTLSAISNPVIETRPSIDLVATSVRSRATVAAGQLRG